MSKITRYSYILSSDSVRLSVGKETRGKDEWKVEVGKLVRRNYPGILKSREGLFLSSLFHGDCVRRYQKGQPDSRGFQDGIRLKTRGKARLMTWQMLAFPLSLLFCKRFEFTDILSVLDGKTEISLLQLARVTYLRLRKFAFTRMRRKLDSST